MPEKAGMVDDATWDKLIELLGSGLKVKEACAAVAMNPSVLHRKRARDPAFNVRLTAVWDPSSTRRKTRARKREVVVRALNVPAVAKALDAGASLRSLLSETQRKQLFQLRKVRPDALGGRVLQKRIGRDEIARALEAVQGGHPITRLRELGLPSGASLHLHRKRDQYLDAAFSAETRTRLAGFQASDLSQAIAELKRGGDDARLRERGLPSRDTIRRRVRSDATLRTAWRELDGRRRKVGTRPTASGAQLWTTVSAAVSPGLPDFIRQDVIGEMVADVLDGFLQPADIRGAAREYVAEHFRQAGTHRTRSLDADLYGDGGRTLHDLLSAP